VAGTRGASRRERVAATMRAGPTPSTPVRSLPPTMSSPPHVRVTGVDIKPYIDNFVRGRAHADLSITAVTTTATDEGFHTVVSLEREAICAAGHRCRSIRTVRPERSSGTRALLLPISSSTPKERPTAVTVDPAGLIPDPESHKQPLAREDSLRDVCAQFVTPTPRPFRLTRCRFTATTWPGCHSAASTTRQPFLDRTGRQRREAYAQDRRASTTPSTPLCTVSGAAGGRASQLSAAHRG